MSILNMSHSLVIKMLKIVAVDMGGTVGRLPNRRQPHSFISNSLRYVPTVIHVPNSASPTKNIEDDSYTHQICFKLMLAGHPSISLHSQMGNSLQICSIPKHPSKHPTWLFTKLPPKHPNLLHICSLQPTLYPIDSIYWPLRSLAQNPTQPAARRRLS